MWVGVGGSVDVWVYVFCGWVWGGVCVRGSGWVWGGCVCVCVRLCVCVLGGRFAIGGGSSSGGLVVSSGVGDHEYRLKANLVGGGRFVVSVFLRECGVALVSCLVHAIVGLFGWWFLRS